MFENTITSIANSGPLLGDPSTADMEATLKEQRLRNLQNAKEAKQARLGFNPEVSLQQNLSDAVDEQIYTNADGSMYQNRWSKDAAGNTVVTKVPFQGQTRNLYIDNTVTGDMKLGLARSDQKGFTGRYDPKLHPGWKKTATGELAGPMGVTRKDGPLMDIKLPYDYATAFEYGVHSDPEQIKNRSMGLGPTKDATTEALYGSGQTEYTTQNAPMWNSDYVGSAEKITGITPLPKDPTWANPRYDPQAETKSMPDYNDLRGFAAGTGLLAGKVAEGIGGGIEKLGEWQEKYNLRNKPIKGDKVSETLHKWQTAFADYAKEEGKQIQTEQIDWRTKGKWNELTGFDASEIQKYGEKFADNVEKGEVVDAVAGLFSPVAITAFVHSAPEMIAMANPLGLGVVMAANVNKNLNDLYINAEKSGTEVTKGNVAVSMGLSILGTYLDRIGDKAVLGSTLGAMNKTLDAMPVAVRNKVLESLSGPLMKAGIYATTAGGKVLLEGGTEGAQQILEGKASDVTKQNLSLTPGEKREALEATGIGLGAGGTPVAAGVAKDIVTNVAPITAQTLDTLDKSTGNKRKDVYVNTELDSRIKKQEAILETIDKTSPEYASIEKKLNIDKLYKAAMPNMSKEEKNKLEGIEREMYAIRTEIGALDPTDPTYDDAMDQKVATLSELEIEQENMVRSKITTEEAITTPAEPTVEEPVSATKPTVEEVVTTQPDVTTEVDNFMTTYETNQKESSEVDAEPVATKKAQLRRGNIAKVLNILDRTSGITLELSDDVRPTEMSNKKERLFDPLDVDADTIKAIVTGDKEVSSGQSHLDRVNKKLDDTSTQPGVRTQLEEVVISKIAGNDKAKEILSKLMDDTSDYSVLRTVAIAVAAIKGGIEAEKNITSSSEMSNKEIEMAEGLTRLPTIDVQIGRAYMNSLGAKLAGEDVATTKEYQKIGKIIIEAVEEMGIVERKKGTKLSPHNMVDPKKLLGEGRRTKSLAMPALSLTISGQKEQVNALVTLNKLLKAPNLQLPYTEAQTSVPMAKGGKDVGLEKAHTDIVKKYSTLRYRIKPSFLKLLKEIKAEVERVGGLDAAVANKKGMLYNLLRLKDSEAELVKDSESGRKINKVGNLQRLLDNLDTIEAMIKENDGIQFHYESSISERIHLLNTVLDYQGDKFLSRPILTGGESTISMKEGDQARRLLENDLVDVLGMDSVESIYEPEAGSILKTAYKYMPNGEISLRDLNSLTTMFKLSRPFETKSAIEAAYALYKAKKDGTDAKTDYVTGVDVRASGLTNTLYDLFGLKSVRDTFEKFKEGYDGYTLTLNTIINNLKKPSIDGDKAIDIINELIEVMTGEKVNITDIDMKMPKGGYTVVQRYLRELAKPPVMTWIYGQADEGLKKTIGNDIAVDLINKSFNDENIVKYINKILGKDVYSIDTIKGITKADQRLVENYFSESIGKQFIDALQETYPYVKTYREVMGKLYDILDGSGKWEGTIQSAMGAMLGSDKKMSIRKLKSVLEDATEDEMLVVNKMLNNKTSFNVNLQHSVDAALLLLTLREVLADMKKSGNTDGIMTVHDAFYSSPATALKIMQIYNQKTKEVAMKYDFLSAAIKEIEDVVQTLRKENTEASNKTANKMVKLLDGVKTKYKEDGFDIDQMLEDKVKYLKDEPISIIGDYEIGLEQLSEAGKVNPTEAEVVVAENKKVEMGIKDILTKLKNAISETTQDSEGMMTLIELLKELQGLDKVSATHKMLLEKIEDVLMGRDNAGKDMKFRVSVKEDKDIGFSGLSGIVTTPQITENMKDPRTKKGMTINGLIEILGHEVDHAIQMDWMYDKKNRNSSEMKYLGRVVERLLNMNKTKLSSAAKKRVEYILNPLSKADIEKDSLTPDDVKVYQIAELVSILSNEVEVANEIVNALNVKKETLLDMVKKIIEKSYKAFSEMLSNNTVDSLDIDADTIAAAIKSLDQNARVNTAMANSEGVPVTPGLTDPKDIYKTDYMDPLHLASEVVANVNAKVSDFIIIYGDAAISVIAPQIRTLHVKAERKSQAYRQAVNLIRSGVSNSQFLQKFFQSIKLIDTSKREVLDAAQTLFLNLNKESESMREWLGALDRKIQKEYKTEAEREAIYRIFNKTGIAHLTDIPDVYKGITENKMSIKDALKMVGKKIDDSEKSILDDIAKYYTTGINGSGYTNVHMSPANHMDAEIYVALKALSSIKDVDVYIQNMKPELWKEMMDVATTNRRLNDKVNKRAKEIDTGKPLTEDAQFFQYYEGTYSMELLDAVYDYRKVSIEEARTDKYSKQAGWKVLKAPTKDTLGLVARENLAGAMVPGIGLNINRYSNGIYLDSVQSKEIWNELNSMSRQQQDEYLIRNQIVREGDRFRFMISDEVKIKELGMKQNVAHSLYRTAIHNKELVESQTIRDLLLDAGRVVIKNEEDMKAFVDRLIYNQKQGIRGDMKPIEPFVTIEYEYEFDKLHPLMKRQFKTPTNLSTYNDFNKKISLVKIAESDILLGHKNASLFGNTEMRELAKVEQLFKDMIVMAKQKFIVTNPVKLATDMASNIGILLMHDMTYMDIARGMKKGWDGLHEMNKLHGELLELKMQLMMVEANGGKIDAVKNRLAKKEQEIKDSDFYMAYKNGFIQSYSTDLVVKEFDTITGVQSKLNEIVDQMTHDKKGNPNELHKAIKWWINLGGDKLSVDGWMRAAGKLGKMNGTTVGEEMVAIADRLKSKKDADSVAAYISEILWAPSSEVVAYGGAVMVATDAISKYTLATFKQTRVNPQTGKKYTETEAYQLANDTFIDYRYNLPAEVKALSDYGILLFPAFWLKVQRMIVQLVKYHPVNSLGGYALEHYMNMTAVNILNEAFPIKFSEGSIMHNPVDVVDMDALVGPLVLF